MIWIFWKKTCQFFFIFEGSGEIKLSNQPNFSPSKVGNINKTNLNVTRQIKKKIKPVSNDKKISKILKKIEIKECEINEMTIKLQSLHNFDSKDSKYNQIIENIKNAQFELDLLEKEWIEIEESSIEND